jgi:hypothetical protein
LIAAKAAGDRSTDRTARRTGAIFAMDHGEVVRADVHRWRRLFPQSRSARTVLKG